MPTDLHAHHVPAEVIGALQQEPGRYGITVRRDAGGGIEGLAFSDAEQVKAPVPDLLDLERNLRFLDEQGLDRQVISTWIDMQGYTLEPGPAQRWCSLLNSSLARAVRSAGRGDRLLALGAVPLQDGGRAAAVLEEAVSGLGLAGVQIATQFGGEGLDRSDLDPFWRKAEALNALVMIHPVELRPSPRVSRYARPFLVANPFETVMAASDLIFGGVIDRFPDLRILLCHGGGFLPYQIGRLQRGYETRPALREAVRRAPRDYLRWFWYDTVLNQPEALRFLIDMAGIDQVVLGTDYPYGFGDLQPLRSIREAGLGPSEERRIADENPARLLRRGAVGGG